MNKNLFNKTIVTLSISIIAFGCKPKPIAPVVDINIVKNDALNNTAYKVIQQGYDDMSIHTQLLLSYVQEFQTTPTNALLTSAKNEWLATRESWEKSESWLFDPISTDNIDPRIDTWPVDFNSLDSLLNSSAVLNEPFKNQLDDALKGFHPIEYVLWGLNGNKQASSITAREREYLVSLVTNLDKLCIEVKTTWKTSFAKQLADAGKGSTEYSTQKLAYIQLCDAMVGICDEVANGKINEPFLAQNPMLEESPFSKNSLVDFRNNIVGVLKLYQGQFNTDGTGLEDVIKFYNTSLDAEIKSKHQSALVAIDAITLPFGQAIISQPVAVQNAIQKINDLKLALDSKLKPLIQLQIQ